MQSHVHMVNKQNVHCLKKKMAEKNGNITNTILINMKFVCDCYKHFKILYILYFNCDVMYSLFDFLDTLLSGSSEVDRIGNLSLLFVLIPKYILSTYNNNYYYFVMICEIIDVCTKDIFKFYCIINSSNTALIFNISHRLHIRNTTTKYTSTVIVIIISSLTKNKTCFELL